MQPKKLIFPHCLHHQHRWVHRLVVLVLILVVIGGSLLPLTSPAAALAARPSYLTQQRGAGRGAVLHFDTTDADQDELPDAITLNMLAAMSKSATWKLAAKRLAVAVFSISLPLPTLTGGLIATVNLAVSQAATVNTTPLLLDLVSFSDPGSHDLPFTDQDGTLTITGNTAAPQAIFLPLVVR